MPKCTHCSRIIENNDIMYRPAPKGRSNQSIRLCYQCAQNFDQKQQALRIRNIGLVVVVAAILIVAAVYLAIR